MQIIKKLHQTISVYAVFSVKKQNDHNILYIGYERLEQVFQLRKLQLNSEAIKYVNYDTDVEVTIHHISDSKTECINKASQLIKMLHPILNFTGIFLTSKNAKIICNETGEEFNSLNECANHFKISRTSLHYHLNRRKYYDSVKGLTFKRDGSVYGNELRQRKKYLDSKTGDIFESISAIAKKLDVSRQSVYDHLRGKINFLKGTQIQTIIETNH